MNRLGLILVFALVSLLATGCPPPSRTQTTDQKDPEDTASEVTDLVEEVLECTGEPACPKLGVCKGKVLPICDKGQWTCDFSLALDYEETEKSCDGKDNDCDGFDDLDELFTGISPQDACPEKLVGVCGEAAETDIMITCVKGEDNAFAFSCDFSNVVDYVADERFTLENKDIYCDTADNDCDGEVDEFMSFFGELTTEEIAALSFVECPKFEGVCSLTISENEPQMEWDIAGDIYFRCSEAGILECATLDIPDYDSVEATCDGIDNDCDGDIDEALDAEVSTCLHLGMCEEKVLAMCSEGTWYCNYEQILDDPAFEYNDPTACLEGADPLCGAESMCDNIDNDCDGEVDEGMTWPVFPEDCGDNIDNNSNGKKDCEESLCAQYSESCSGSTPPVFTDCPVTEEKLISGIKVKIPVLDQHGFPLLPGVCGGSDISGESPVHIKCVPLVINSKVVGATWKCNYDDVEHYVVEEKYYPGGDSSICDGLDNDCDGTVDDPGEIVVGDKIEETSCRFLGECNNNVVARCNVGGLRPGRWSCDYNLGDVQTVSVPQGCNPDDSNCYWEELTCDGKDNDCDGLTDEMLSGRQLEVEEVCSQFLGKGVCTEDLVNTVCEINPGTGKPAFKCDMSGIFNYSPAEDNKLDLCDSKDNDCDGLVDENIATTQVDNLKTYTPCLYQGVCGQGTVATCNNGIWSCNYSAVSSFGNGFTYQIPSGPLVEVECDGKDNDCDGVIDEDLNVDLGTGAGLNNPKLKSNCRLKGVCTGTTQWGCADSKWVCNYSGATGFEDLEVSCDLQDNDCDGYVDEQLSDIGPNGANCKSAGVCSGPGVTASCVDGGWVCSYSGVQFYEGAKEYTCDGRDNDCDSSTDEDLSWEEANACITQGVCNSDLLDALCLGNLGWNCVYGNIPDWQPSPESLCDTKDNDCDGLTDEAACQICQPCSQNSNCMTNACNSAPQTGGGGAPPAPKYCASGAFNCVIIDPYSSQCLSIVDNGYSCSTTSQPVQCIKGTWYTNGPQCPVGSPFCVNGTCRVCYPGSKRCEANNVSECNIDGSAWVVKFGCPSGEICVGSGACVNNSEVKVSSPYASTSNLEAYPKGAARKGGGFLVVYETDSFNEGVKNADIAGRLYNSSLAADGDVFAINSYMSGDQSNPDVSPIPSTTGGFVVVWESLAQDGNGKGIFFQRLSPSGQKVGMETQANLTVTGDQFAPAVAAYSDGSFTVAWISVDGSGYGVYARRFDANGAAVGGEFAINQYTTNNQEQIDISIRGTAGYAASWTSIGQDGSAVESQGIMAHYYNSAMVKSGTEIFVNLYNEAGQKNSTIGGFGGSRSGWVAIAWESFGQDGSGNGVYMNYFNSSGEPLISSYDIQCNTAITLNTQKDPTLAVMEDNKVVVVWETVGLPGELTNSYGIANRLFSEDGAPLGTGETGVNQTLLGQQNNPDVISIGDKVYVVIWNHVPDGADPQSQVYFRAFKAL